MSWLLRFITGNTNAENKIDDAIKALSVETQINESQPTEEIDENLCYQRVGRITKITEDNVITIDNKYEFSVDSELPIGQSVSYITYFEERKEKVANIKVIEDEWEINEIQKSSKWCYRTLIGKLLKREGRVLFIDPGNITLNLNEVRSEFIPIEGDWLQIEAKCVLDEAVVNLNGKIIEIIKINPLRPKVIEGVIRIWDISKQEGQINSNVYFERSSLSMGYIPQGGDKVIVEIIESERDRCNWRATKVVPNIDGKRYKINEYKTQIENEDINIEIEDNIILDFEQMNQSKNFQIKIINRNEKDVPLNTIKLAKSGGFLKIEYPIKFPTIIPSKEQIFVIGNYTIRTAGSMKEMIIFEFEHSVFNRFLQVDLSSGIANSDFSGRQYRPNRETLISNVRRYRNTISNNHIRGPGLNTTNRFSKVNIPHYNVPDKLWDIILQNKTQDEIAEDLKRAKLVFNQPLSFQFYKDRFHTLLHLEEIAEVIAMGKFDRDRVPFIKNGEFLMLEIENLSEQRPSIVIGDSVVVKNPYNDNFNSFEGIVERLGAKHLYLRFHPGFHNSYDGEDYSIRVKPSRSKMKKLHHAVSLALQNLSRDVLFPSKIVTKPPQVVFTSEPLRYNDEKKGLSNSSRIENDNCMKLEWFNRDLNMIQKIAVKNILEGVSRPMPYLIYGPPGTGKTITLVEVILQTLRMIPHSRILVAAPSNSAANLITTRLIESGVINPGDLVRLVAYKCIMSDSIPENLAPFCSGVSWGNNGNSERMVTPNGLVLGVDSATIGRHRVTVSTCNTVGAFFQKKFDKGHFTHIMIDEAGQTIEPEIMIPMSFLDLQNGQCVLAGDPQQLGPVTISTFAKDFGLDESYLERLINRFPYVRDIVGFPESGGFDPKFVTKLLNNYRSLPGILHVPNELFYYSELIPTVNSTDSPQIKLLSKLKNIVLQNSEDNLFPFIFHGVNGRNIQLPDCPSWYNPDEISQIFFYINQLYGCGVDSSEIGIITPYIKQVKEIRSVLTQADFDLPHIGTVEEFQGQEYSVVILSTVRSNKDMVTMDMKHHIGFIGQPKRMNVALTRAKALLIVIGNPHLLTFDSAWRRVISFAVENRSYVGCELPQEFQLN